MHFYQLLRDGAPDCVPEFHGKQSDAHTAAKMVPLHLRPETRIELVDVPTDKDSIERLLNGHGLSGLNALKTWKLTPRGGLVDCANGE